MAEEQERTVDVKALYFHLIKRLGMEATDNQGKRLRQHPRFKFGAPEKTILVQIDEFNCSLHDVSVGGISFLSMYNFNIGRSLTLNFDGMFHVGANVVRVVLHERAEDKAENIYLHGCQFLSERDGYRCTVLVLNRLVAIMRQ